MRDEARFAPISTSSSAAASADGSDSAEAAASAAGSDSAEAVRASSAMGETMREGAWASARGRKLVSCARTIIMVESDSISSPKECIDSARREIVRGKPEECHLRARACWKTEGVARDDVMRSGRVCEGRWIVNNLCRKGIASARRGIGPIRSVQSLS